MGEISVKKLYVLILGLFILLLCVSSANASLFDFGGNDNNDGKNITLIKEITSCYIYNSSSGIIHDYKVEGVLKNIPGDANKYTIKGVFYDGNNVVGEDERSLDYFSPSSEKSRPNTIVSIYKNESLNISKVEISITNPSGEVVFTQSVPFNMYDENNHVTESNNVSTSNNDTKQSTSVRYVASSNSNKFHALSCSQASRIKDSNKITFSSREEAVNAGYTPCGLCKP